MPFDPAYPLTKTRAASYNPRVIEPSALGTLRASLRLAGMVKPLILTSDGLTVAGHQRGKAARAEGWTTAPAYLLETGLTMADEVRFNQLHNGTDVEEHCAMVSVPAGPLGFHDVAPDTVRTTGPVPGATTRAAICELIQRYGTWGAVVASASGRVLSAPQYAMACRALMVPCRVCRVPDAIAEQVAGYFRRRYGEFSYDHIPRTTWAQTFAQPWRLRTGDKVSRAESILYERYVLPVLSKRDRVLDFGCGQADYVRALGKIGYQMHGIEFFYRGGTKTIDTAGAHAMIDATLADFAKHGPFDVVVCDSVLNSVDSKQAEADVLTSLSAFLKLGGLAIFSGRRREDGETRAKATETAGFVSRVEFLDKDGLQAIHSRGSCRLTLTR